MGERVWKVLLSLVAIGLFALAVAVVADIGSFQWSRRPAGIDGAQVKGGYVAPGAEPELPVPPDTELTLNTRAHAGGHYRYESRLSAEGLWRFYTEQAPRQGWTRDRAFEAAWRRGGALQPVLSFKKQGTRCIIGLEQGDTFTTVVTVLVVGVPR